MSMQMRANASDERYYSPNRDLAHNFHAIMGEVVKSVDEGRWPVLTDMATKAGVTRDELGRACAALCSFVEVNMNNKGESMAACLQRCGFLDINPVARVVAMAYLGNVILGFHWCGVREATLGGKGPALTYKGLAAEGARAARLMGMSRTRRAWFRLKSRAAAVWAALRGSDKSKE